MEGKSFEWGGGVYFNVVFNVSCMAAILTLVITIASHRLQ
jgi:hypothetical protein